MVLMYHGECYLAHREILVIYVLQPSSISVHSTAILNIQHYFTTSILNISIRQSEI